MTTNGPSALVPEAWHGIGVPSINASEANLGLCSSPTFHFLGYLWQVPSPCRASVSLL